MQRQVRTIIAATAASVASAAVVLGVVATPAYAASTTVSYANGVVSYVAGQGQVNQVKVTFIPGWIGVPNTIVIDDTQAITVPVVRGGYCTHPTADRTVVHCNPPGIVTVAIDTGDGDDIINYINAYNDATLSGGSGSDVIHTSSGTSVRTTVFGGTGNDKIYSYPSDDTIDGGIGADTVSFVRVHTADIHASLITGTGGEAGEADTYASIENLTGGHGDDVLIGDDAANVISGGSGDDQIYGNGGADTLNGDYGDGTYVGQDYIRGGTGDDILRGDNGSDMLFGDEGNDSLRGGDDSEDELSDFELFYDRLDGGVGTDQCGLNIIDQYNPVADVAIACEVVYYTEY